MLVYVQLALILITHTCSFLFFLLLGLFSSSGVAGMVMNIILPLYPVQCILLLYFPYLCYTSPSTWFSVFLSVSGTGASNILLSTCPSSLLLTCPYHFSLSFSVIFFVTGATFTDPLTCSHLHTRPQSE